MTARRVFFIGSGASLPDPAGLPLFGHLRTAATQGLTPLMRARLTYLAPEPLFTYLTQAGVKMNDVLPAVFSTADARPNAVHFVLAHQLLSADAKVWTTNYDTLIEDAVAWLSSIRRTSVDLEKVLKKPHGTFIEVAPGRWEGSKDLLAESRQVVVDWQQHFKDALRRDCSGAEVVLLGYSGVDVNSYRALRRALKDAAQVRWYIVEPSPERERERVCFRFPELTDDQVVGAANPSAEFVRAYGAGLDLSRETPLLHNLHAAPVTGHKADLSSVTRRISQFATQGIVAREMGERRVARFLLSEAIAGGVTALVPRAAMIKHAQAVQYLRAGGRGMALRLPVWVPLPDGVKSRAVADRRYSTVPAAEAALDRMEGWFERTKEALHRARLLLAQCAALRYLGRFEEAVARAEEALVIARAADGPSPTEAARAEFELVESLRTLGRFEEAFEVTRMRLHTLGMSHWGAWLDYELACLYLQLRDAAKAGANLELAGNFFFSIDRRHPETTYDPRLGQDYVRLTLCALDRLRGDLGGAQSHLDSHQSEAGPHHSSMIRWIRSFQQGEILRGQSGWSDALARYESILECRIETSRGLGLLGRALCMWGQSHASADEFRKAAEAFAELESGFGLAYCLRFSRAAGVHVDVPARLHRRTHDALSAIWPVHEPALPTDQIAWI